MAISIVPSECSFAFPPAGSVPDIDSPLFGNVNVCSPTTPSCDNLLI